MNKNLKRQLSELLQSIGNVLIEEEKKYKK